VVGSFARQQANLLAGREWGKALRDNREGGSMLLVTGGAGFIGSNVVAALNDAGRDVAVCDVLGDKGKWRNLAKRRLADFVPPLELMEWLKGRRLVHGEHNADDLCVLGGDLWRRRAGI
jgi:ADP-L-glycero-D-manno-heptose 6-epimerase